MKDIKWSGKSGVPAIGSIVKVLLNGLGTGKVVSYFEEDGYLGVKVKLDNPPSWMKRQNPDNIPASVFGAEIDYE